MAKLGKCSDCGKRADTAASKHPPHDALCEGCEVSRDEFLEAVYECPMCGTENAPLGALGRRVHYCCRACGAYSSTEAA